MHSDSILQALSAAAYIATIVVFGFLYAGMLTAWSFVVVFIFIWIILAGVVLQRSSKAAERDMAQRIFKVLGQEAAKSKETKELLTKMRSQFPYKGKVN
jgi:hypothetical protein